MTLQLMGYISIQLQDTLLKLLLMLNATKIPHFLLLQFLQVFFLIKKEQYPLYFISPSKKTPKHFLFSFKTSCFFVHPKIVYWSGSR